MPQFVGAVGVAGLAAIVTARSAAPAPDTTAKLATLGGLQAATPTAGFVCCVGLLVANLTPSNPVASDDADHETGCSFSPHPLWASLPEKLDRDF
ncbi:hypothetical protein ACFYZ0_07195 [Streptomyces sp. NPDC001708]|uniref:hypothetical protein n=1 Tax=Streptomyces sp. NPDC001708 TaxID=3364602 RepID=UPI00369CF717